MEVELTDLLNGVTTLVADEPRHFNNAIIEHRRRARLFRSTSPRNQPPGGIMKCEHFRIFTFQT